MKCYQCKTDLPEDAKFCSKCGAEQGFSENLIRKAMEGDQASITALYNRTYNNAYHTVKSMIRDEDTVLDIIQDSYVKAFKNLNQLQDAEKFRAWIKRICHNQAVDYLRKTKLVMFSQLSTEDNEVVEFEDDRVENLPEVAMDQKETSRLIKDILDSLSDEQRLAVGMFYYEQISVKEIAEILGVSENTVKSRLNYARKKIEEKVTRLEKEQGIRLHSLAPVPFLLWLFRCQEAQAAELPNMEVLSALEKECAGSSMQAAGSSGSGNGKAPNMSATGTQAARSAAGIAGKGLAVKVIAGIAAVAVIGGGATVAYKLMNDQPAKDAVETEVQTEKQADKEQQGTSEITTEDFAGDYTSNDTRLAISVTPIDDKRAVVYLDNISPDGANAFNQKAIATLEENVLAMEAQTDPGEIITLTLSGSELIVEASEEFQSRANTVINGIYTREGKSQNIGSANIDEFVGEYMNGQDWDAGILTITKNDDTSVNVLLEGHINQLNSQVTTIFEGIGYPTDDGIRVEISGEEINIRKGTIGLVLDVPESLRNEFNAFRSVSSLYENEYFSTAPDMTDPAYSGTGVDLMQYDGYSYYENDHIKYRIDTADSNLALTMWAMSGEPVFYEMYFYMDLSTAYISGDTYVIYDIVCEGGPNPRYIDNIQFTFGDTVTMTVQGDESLMAGGAGDNILLGTYTFTK